MTTAAFGHSVRDPRARSQSIHAASGASQPGWVAGEGDESDNAGAVSAGRVRASRALYVVNIALAGSPRIGGGCHSAAEVNVLHQEDVNGLIPCPVAPCPPRGGQPK